ncbi:MAG TPA: acetyl-CoA C-acetyltransferase [Gammaproteobacteria bacterium]|nr:acetyl-CoA C-acetyltransferase [Gammaproteobacteria bacterium]
METKPKTSQHSVVYLIDGLRTPFLKARGIPGAFSAADLAVEAGKALLARQNFSVDKIDQVILGCVSPSEEEANIARIVALRLGCPTKTPAWTVQRNCASGLQSIDSAAQSIAKGQSDLVLAGGVEAMSRIPLTLNRAMVTWLGEMSGAKTLTQKLRFATHFRPHYLVPVVALLKGLTDPVVNLNMGQTAEELAFQYRITRKEMDEFAVSSHRKATKALEQGLLREVTPLYSRDGVVTEIDDGIRKDSSLEKLSKLKPVFDKFGNITAGNSSQVTDGAALVLLASEQAVAKYRLPILAKIVDINWAALDPVYMGLAPVHAMTPLMQKHHLNFNDIDHFEINEAFAAQVLACLKLWQDENYCQKNLGLKGAFGTLPLDKLNPEGGAIAMGHPVGASGARLVLHSALMLKAKNQKRALCSLCIGGGQGGAVILSRVTGDQ